MSLLKTPRKALWTGDCLWRVDVERMRIDPVYYVLPRNAAANITPLARRFSSDYEAEVLTIKGHTENIGPAIPSGHYATDEQIPALRKMGYRWADLRPARESQSDILDSVQNSDLRSERPVARP